MATLRRNMVSVVPAGSGVPIALAAQQQLKNVRMEMTPTGAISGRILNRYGEPVGNANVQALRYTYQEGRRTLTTVQTIRSNDLGEYRLFWMTPGQYVISAQPAESLAVDPGGTVFFQALRGGGTGARRSAVGAQFGVGGVTRITVSGAGGPPPDFPGGAVPPPHRPHLRESAGIDDSNLVYSRLLSRHHGRNGCSTLLIFERAAMSVESILTVVETRPVRIRGQVLNSGRPAAGAQVSIYQRSSNTGGLDDP